MIHSLFFIDGRFRRDSEANRSIFRRHQQLDSKSVNGVCAVSVSVGWV